MLLGVAENDLHWSFQSLITIAFLWITREGWRLRKYVFSTWRWIAWAVGLIERTRHDGKKVLRVIRESLMTLEKSPVLDPQTKSAIRDLRALVDDLDKMADESIIIMPSAEIPVANQTEKTNEPK